MDLGKTSLELKNFTLNITQEKIEPKSYQTNEQKLIFDGPEVRSIFTRIRRS